ncbi:MAG: hypothetical protein ACRECO_10385 [Xanthobacteraceae bacterium]
MADYYPLIARAVAGLEKNTGDARRALYERARTALVAQLRGVTPALSENDVTRERLALEESIRKVEAEAARKNWVDPAQGPRVRAPEFPRWERPPGAAEADDGEPPPRRSGPPLAEAPAARPTAARGARMPPPSPGALGSPGSEAANMRGEQRYVDPVFDQPLPSDPALAPRNASPRPRPDGAQRKSLLDAGLNDFRNVVSETDELGEAPARAAKSARDVYAAVAPQQADYRSEGHYMNSHGDAHAPEANDYPAPPMLEPARDYDDEQPLPARPYPGAGLERRSSQRSIKDFVKTAVILLLLACFGGIAAWQWPNISLLYRALLSPTAPATDVARDTAEPKRSTKIPDRLQSGAPSTQAQPAPANVPAAGQAAAVAQKVVLYEEDPENPQGKRFVGSAIWRTERVSTGAGNPPEIAVRADVEIPDRKLAMTWSLRRNTDKSLPATHTVEIVFKLPPDFPSGGIANVPGILMKQAEQTRGVPLAGLAVKVTNEFFLIGLSAIEADRERNVQMLKERAWFDIPVVYNNNRRAILAVEKGTPGERVFAEAFAAWKQ